MRINFLGVVLADVLVIWRFKPRDTHVSILFHDCFVRRKALTFLHKMRNLSYRGR